MIGHGKSNRSSSKMHLISILSPRKTSQPDDSLECAAKSYHHNCFKHALLAGKVVWKNQSNSLFQFVSEISTVHIKFHLKNQKIFDSKQNFFQTHVKLHQTYTKRTPNSHQTYTKRRFFENGVFFSALPILHMQIATFFFTYYVVVKRRVAFFSGNEVSDTSDRAKTSKCHALRPLCRGMKSVEHVCSHNWQENTFRKMQQTTCSDLFQSHLLTLNLTVHCFSFSGSWIVRFPGCFF